MSIVGQQVAVQKPQSPVLQQQQQQHQGYNIPIPKILARRQVEPAPPSNNEYANQMQ